jgi:hypothetical protein
MALFWGCSLQDVVIYYSFFVLYFKCKNLNNIGV